MPSPANPALRDTDGDGMSDGAEYASGTGIDDPTSFLALSRLQAAGRDAIVTWPSVAGKSYQMEFTADDLAVGASFAPVSGRIVANDPETSFTVPGGGAAARGHFRVRLLEEGP